MKQEAASRTNEGEGDLSEIINALPVSGRDASHLYANLALAPFSRLSALLPSLGTFITSFLTAFS